MLLRNLIFSALVCTAPAVAVSPVPASPVGYNGAIVSTAEDAVVLRQKDGTLKTVAMTPGWTVGVARQTSPEAIKPGDFIASANANIDAGSGKANEIRIFEPGYRPEIGTHGMPQPNVSMTHGTVESAAATADGSRELKIVYPDGSRRILVPADVKVTAYDLRDRAAAAPGVMVGAVTRKGPDGVERAGRLLITTP